MKIIIYFALAFSTMVSFATVPYRVVGIACHEGEHCMKNPKDDLLGSGYYIKSNVPFNDSRQKEIRKNMFTRAVLKKELNNRDKVIKNKDKELEKCRLGIDRDDADSESIIPNGVVESPKLGGGGSISFPMIPQNDFNDKKSSGSTQ